MIRSMEATTNANAQPVLQKPPGYRDPSAPPRVNLPVRPSFRDAHYRRSKKRSRRSCFGKCCCWIFLLLLILAFIVAIAGGLSYLYFQPKLPSFRIESFQVPKFNITSKNEASFLDSKTVLRIKIGNPNRRIKISLAPIEASVTTTGNVDLGSGTYPSLYLESKNSSVIRIEAEVKGSEIDEFLAKKLRSKFQSRNMDLMVNLKTNLRVPRVPVTVVCGSFTLKQIDGGASPICEIRVFHW